jgi:large subunit ribosomal protein L5
MYDFLEKFLKIVLPRIRDFRGIPAKSLDGRGNLNIGISDQTLFPEIDYDKIDKIRGLEITLVTSATSDVHARKLLEEMGLIFID